MSTPGFSVEILRYYLEGDVRSVGTGGFGSQFLEEWDISNLRYPARLTLNRTEKVIQRVEMEDTIRVLSGDMKGTYAQHMRISFHGAIPIESRYPIVNGSVIGVFLARDASEAHVVNTKSNIDVSYDRTFDRGKIVYAYDVGKYVSMGLGAEIASDPARLSYMDGEILLKPQPTLTVGFRRTPRDIVLDIQGLYQGQFKDQKAFLPLESSYFLNEVSLKQTIGDSMALYASDDLGNPADYFLHARAAVPTKVVMVEASYRQEHDRLDGSLLSPQGDVLGTIHIGIENKRVRTGASFILTKNHSMSLHYQRAWQTWTGRGDSTGDIIPQLVFGQKVGLNLNFSNSLSFISDQFSWGYEWNQSLSSGRSRGLSLRTGFQHLSLYPGNGETSFEASVPNSSDPYLQERDSVKLNKIILGFFTAGLGYSWEHLQVNYAFAQVLPIFVRSLPPPPSESNPPPGSPPPSTENQGSKGWFEEFLDTFKMYRGGNTQLLELSYTF